MGSLEFRGDIDTVALAEIPRVVLGLGDELGAAVVEAELATDGVAEGVVAGVLDVAGVLVLDAAGEVEEGLTVPTSTAPQTAVLLTAALTVFFM